MKALSAPFVKPIKAQPNRARCMNSCRKGSNSQVRLMGGSGKDMGLKSFLDIFRGENHTGVAESHQLTIQKDHLIKQVPDRSQFVVRYDKQIARIGQAANRAAEQVLRRFIQT